MLTGTGFQVKSWKTTSLKGPLHKNYLVSENSSSINLVEDAAGIAGIKPTQTTCLAIQQPGQRVEFNKEVSSAHIYPSPFSQVTVRGIDWISIMTCLSRFPMKIDLTPVRSATSVSREQMSANATKESTQTRVHSVSAQRMHTDTNNSFSLSILFKEVHTKRPSSHSHALPHEREAVHLPDLQPWLRKKRRADQTCEDAC